MSTCGSVVRSHRSVRLRILCKPRPQRSKAGDGTLASVVTSPFSSLLQLMLIGMSWQSRHAATTIESGRAAVRVAGGTSEATGTTSHPGCQTKHSTCARTAVSQEHDIAILARFIARCDTKHAVLLPVVALPQPQREALVIHDARLPPPADRRSGCAGCARAKRAASCCIVLIHLLANAIRVRMPSNSLRFRSRERHMTGTGRAGDMPCRAGDRRTDQTTGV